MPQTQHTEAAAEELFGTATLLLMPGQQQQTQQTQQPQQPQQQQQEQMQIRIHRQQQQQQGQMRQMQLQLKTISGTEVNSCPFCDGGMGCPPTTGGETVGAEQPGSRTRQRRCIKSDRKSYKLGRWWINFGYSGPKYCQRCSEVFRDHIIRQIQNSAQCARDRPCDDCLKVLANFQTTGPQLYQIFDEQAQKNLIKKSVREQRNDTLRMVPPSPSLPLRPPPVDKSRSGSSTKSSCINTTLNTGSIFSPAVAAALSTVAREVAAAATCASHSSHSSQSAESTQEDAVASEVGSVMAQIVFAVEQGRIFHVYNCSDAELRDVPLTDWHLSRSQAQIPNAGARTRVYAFSIHCTTQILQQPPS